MTDIADRHPAPLLPEAEEGLAVSAAIGSIWTGSRLLIGACSFLYAAFAFTFFYLRSLNSHGRWHPPGQHPSPLVGTAAVILLIAAAGVHYFGVWRLRSGLNLDWRVAGVVALGLGLASVGLQIYLLTRLPFFPGASGYASVFVGFWPVQIVLVLGALYWLETLVARSLRVRNAWRGQGDLGGNVTPEAIRLRASLDAFQYFFSFLALAGTAFWFLFYVVQ